MKKSQTIELMMIKTKSPQWKRRMFLYTKNTIHLSALYSLHNMINKLNYSKQCVMRTYEWSTENHTHQWGWFLVSVLSWVVLPVDYNRVSQSWTVRVTSLLCLKNSTFDKKEWAQWAITLLPTAHHFSHVLPQPDTLCLLSSVVSPWIRTHCTKWGEDGEAISFPR